MQPDSTGQHGATEHFSSSSALSFSTRSAVIRAALFGCLVACRAQDDSWINPGPDAGILKDASPEKLSHPELSGWLQYDFRLTGNDFGHQCSVSDLMRIIENANATGEF